MSISSCLHIRLVRKLPENFKWVNVWQDPVLAPGSFLVPCLLLLFTSAPAVIASPGVVDTTFSQTGSVSVTLDYHDTLSGIATQLEGERYLLVGSSRGSSPQGPMNFALVRLNKDGMLDPAFGSAGKISTDFGGDDQALAIAVRNYDQALPEMVIAAGFTDLGGDDDFALARYDETTGALVTSFDGDGRLTTEFSGFDDRATAAAIQSNGRIVVAGWSESGGADGIDFALARYMPDGTLDTEFDGDGKVTTQIQITGEDNWATCMAIQPDGKIVVAGHGGDNAQGGAGSSMLVARYHGDAATGSPGSLDSSFGTLGVVSISFEGGGNANAIAIQPDGKVVLAGESNSRLALARLNSSGALDASFGGGGKVVLEIAPSFGSIDNYFSGVTFQPDGRIVAVGYANGAALVRRFTSSGALDGNFGTRGSVFFAPWQNWAIATAVIAQPDGKIFIAGTIQDGGPTNFLTIRLNTAGGDMQVGTKAKGFRGDNIYSPYRIGSQTSRVSISSGGGSEDVTAVIENKGPVADQFTLRGIGRGTIAPVYFVGRKNRTAEIMAGRYSTGPVAAGAKKLITVRVTAKTKRRGAQKSISLVNQSTNYPPARDLVHIRATTN